MPTHPPQPSRSMQNFWMSGWPSAAKHIVIILKCRPHASGRTKLHHICKPKASSSPESGFTSKLKPDFFGGYCCGVEMPIHERPTCGNVAPVAKGKHRQVTHFRATFSDLLKNNIEGVPSFDTPCRVKPRKPAVGTFAWYATLGALQRSWGSARGT